MDSMGMKMGIQAWRMWHWESLCRLLGQNFCDRENRNISGDAEAEHLDFQPSFRP